MVDRENQARKAVAEVAALVRRTGLTEADRPRLPEALRNAVAWKAMEFLLVCAADNPNVQRVVIGDCRKQKRALLAFLGEVRG